MAGLSRSIVQTAFKRIVKPCFATPAPLRSYKLSLVDQIQFPVYMPIAFFFPSHGSGSHTRTEQILDQLENSLAKTLSYYYPFSGRLVDDGHIDCNDAGVDLIEARVDYSMSGILQNTRSYAEDLVLPEGLPWKVHNGDSLLVIQVTHFNCGGFAVGVCLSHKVADAFTLRTFVNDWATITRFPNHVPSIAFVGASIFPPVNDLPPLANYTNLCSNPVARRFVFGPSEISKLKELAVQLGSAERPTRVEAVSALLHHCAMAAAASTANASLFQPTTLAHAMNLRSLIAQKTPQTYCGNFSTSNYAYVTEEENMKFEKVAAQLRSLKLEFRAPDGERSKSIYTDVQIREMYRQLQRDKESEKWDVQICSSISGLQLYNIDFQWGKPRWVCVGRCPRRSVFYLTDTPKGDGIEALVHLEKTSMEVFESNEMLLSFATSIGDK